MPAGESHSKGGVHHQREWPCHSPERSHADPPPLPPFLQLPQLVRPFLSAPLLPPGQWGVLALSPILPVRENREEEPGRLLPLLVIPRADSAREGPPSTANVTILHTEHWGTVSPSSEAEEVGFKPLLICSKAHFSNRMRGKGERDKERWCLAAPGVPLRPTASHSRRRLEMQALGTLPRPAGREPAFLKGFQVMSVPSQA